MKQPAIHYNNALDPLRNSIPACHAATLGLRTTADIARVTCKNCLRILGRKP